MATALVIGNMVGSGVFGLPSSLASTGPISLLAWGFTGVGALLLALVFANLGRAYPQTGGPYAYTRRAFGDFAGFWTAWGYWIAAWAGNAAIAVIFVSYGSVFWPRLATDNVTAFAVGLSVIWLLTLVNIAGVRETGRVQVVTTVLKFVPLLLIGVIGLFYMRSGNFTPFDPNHVSLVGHWHAISFAATLTLWAFLGLESATIPAEEVKDPERTLPRATIFGTARPRRPLRAGDRGDHGRHPRGHALEVECAVRRRRAEHLRLFDPRHVAGQDRRRGRHDLDVRRAQRLDPDPGPGTARRRPGRSLPAPVRPGERVAQDARRRPGRLLGAAEHPAGHELPVRR